MTNGEALRRAVLADPEDDTVRLAYADYLQEQGEGEQARLIRCQVKRGTGCNSVPWDMPRLRVRRWFAPWWTNRSIWSFHNPQWDLIVSRVRSLSEQGSMSNCFFVRRGFMDEIRLPLAAFMGHAEAIFRSHPVTRVVLTDREPMPVDDAVGRGFGWLGSAYWKLCADGTEHGPHILPMELIDALPKSDLPVRKGLMKRWRLRDDALNALSRACCVVGRERAGKVVAA